MAPAERDAATKLEGFRDGLAMLHSLVGITPPKAVRPRHSTRAKLKAALLAACAAGRGASSTKAEFQERIRRAADLVCSEAGWRYSSAVLEEVVVAASIDEALDMQGAVFVVDAVLKKAKAEKHQRRDAPFVNSVNNLENHFESVRLGKENRHPAERAADRMAPFLGSWLRRLAIHQRRQKTLDKIRTLASLWRQEGWLLQKQHVPLLALLDGSPLPPDVIEEAKSAAKAAAAAVAMRRDRRQANVDQQQQKQEQQRQAASRVQFRGPLVSYGSAGATAKPDAGFVTPRGVVRQESDEQTPGACLLPLAEDSGPSAKTEAPLPEVKSQSSEAVAESKPPPADSASAPASEAAAGQEARVDSSSHASMDDRKRPPTSSATAGPDSAKRPRRQDRQPGGKPGGRQDENNAASKAKLPDFWKVRGDCRCLFRAVHRAYHDPRNAIPRDARGEPFKDSARSVEREGADKLRASMCKIMRRRQDELAALLAGTEVVEEYVTKMQDPHAWGDALCLKFLPDLVGQPIQVYALNTKKQVVYESGMHMPQDPAMHSAQVIVLWYNGRSHYDLVSRDWLEQRERLFMRESAAAAAAPAEEEQSRDAALPLDGAAAQS